MEPGLLYYWHLFYIQPFCYDISIYFTWDFKCSFFLRGVRPICKHTYGRDGKTTLTDILIETLAV